MRASGIIFDFDGTIALSEHVHMDAWRDVAAAHACALPPGFEEKGVGLTDRELAETLAELWRGPTVAALLAGKQTNYQARCRTEALLVPGVDAALTRLGARFPIGLATSASEADISPTLERFGLARHFRVMLTIESVTRGKPDPEIYQKAAAALGIEPALSFAFEDSPAGAAAARAAGLAVIGMTTTFPAGALGPVRASIADYADLDAVLKLVTTA